MEQLLEEIRRKENLRTNLSRLREWIREHPQQKDDLCSLKLEPELLRELLQWEDPKVRKNVAMLIGELQQEALIQELYAAYEQEETLFVRSAYLKAMRQMDASAVLDKLKQRKQELCSLTVPKEEEKHVREERLLLEQLLRQYQIRKGYWLIPSDLRPNVILTTNPRQREVTARQVQRGKVTLVPFGVRVQGAYVGQLQKIRTYRTLLFELNCRTVHAEAETAARELAGSNLLERLQKLRAGGEPFYFRITISGSMNLEKRGAWIKQCAYVLQQETNHQLVNDPSDYEVELLLFPKQNGTFLPLVKLPAAVCEGGLPDGQKQGEGGGDRFCDQRFSYRKHTLAVSIRPEQAALIAALARPYMMEHAQVLDPFCGVGTMLIERDFVKPAGVMYGVDLFGEAIAGAWENTALAGKNVYYVKRDFFDFTHKYLFDEIFTNLPVRGKQSREEWDEFYRKFFQKAGELLKSDGIMVLYSDQDGLIKKQIRLQKKWKLINEYDMDGTERFSVYIIGRKGSRTG